MGFSIEPDMPPRRSPWHRKIKTTIPIPNTKTGHTVVLECGHVVQTFGNLAHAEGVALCTQCRDAAAGH